MNTISVPPPTSSFQFALSCGSISTGRFWPWLKHTSEFWGDHLTALGELQWQFPGVDPPELAAQYELWTYSFARYKRVVSLTGDHPPPPWVLGHLVLFSTFKGKKREPLSYRLYIGNSVPFSCSISSISTTILLLVALFLFLFFGIWGVPYLLYEVLHVLEIFITFCPPPPHTYIERGSSKLTYVPHCWKFLPFYSYFFTLYIQEKNYKYAFPWFKASYLEDKIIWKK